MPKVWMFKKCGEIYSMFHVTWTTFKFNRNQLGTVLAYVMWLWLIALLMCTLKWLSSTEVQCHKGFHLKHKGPFTRSVLRIQFLAPKPGSRRSGGPIARFRFCGESVARSFVVCSHDSFFKTNKESSIWRQNDHAKFVGAFHLSRRVSDENRACSISIRFFQNYEAIWWKIIFNVFTRSVFRNQQKSES